MSMMRVDLRARSIACWLPAVSALSGTAAGAESSVVMRVGHDVRSAAWAIDAPPPAVSAAAAVASELARNARRLPPSGDSVSRSRGVIRLRYSGAPQGLSADSAKTWPLLQGAAKAEVR